MILILLEEHRAGRPVYEFWNTGCSSQQFINLMMKKKKIKTYAKPNTHGVTPWENKF